MKKIITLYVVCLMSTSLLAEDNYEAPLIGDFYIGAGIGRADNGTYKVDDRDFRSEVADDTHLLQKVYPGLYLCEHFVAQLFYIDLGKVNLEGGEHVNIDAYGFDVLWLNGFKAAPRLKFFLKSGLNASKAEGLGLSERKVDLNLGGGMDFIMSEHLRMRGEYGLMKVVGGDSSFFALSLATNF